MKTASDRDNCRHPTHRIAHLNEYSKLHKLGTNEVKKSRHRNSEAG
jgi:hypothetical protein